MNKYKAEVMKSLLEDKETLEAMVEEMSGSLLPKEGLLNFGMPGHLNRLPDFVFNQDQEQGAPSDKKECLKYRRNDGQ